MKICTSLIFLVILFSACKKDQPISGENHLVKITHTDGSVTSKHEFGYDASGKLIKKTYAENGNPPRVQNEITYTGNEVAISYLDEPSYFRRDTRYQLDAHDRPVKRIFSYFDSLPVPLGPQKDFATDTTTYEYDVNGYLMRYTGVSKDSVRYYGSPGVLDVQSNTFTYTTIYEIDAGNLKSVKKTSQQQHVTANYPGLPYSFQRIIEETTVFYYDKKYPNHLDFRNAFLFTELNVLPFSSYVPNPGYLNYPNKAVTTKITKDANGVVLSTDVFTEEPNLNFDTNGYLLTLTNVFSPQSKEIYNYSRF